MRPWTTRATLGPPRPGLKVRTMGPHQSGAQPSDTPFWDVKMESPLSLALTASAWDRPSKPLCQSAHRPSWYLQLSWTMTRVTSSTETSARYSRGGLSCVRYDMRERTTTTKHNVDLYVAGFPCQPFSSAGLRKGEADFRGRIVHSVVDTIQRSLPKAFILENVIGFASVAGGSTFEKVLCRLRRVKDGSGAADDVHHTFLNAADFKVPQSRTSYLL